MKTFKRMLGFIKWHWDQIDLFYKMMMLCASIVTSSLWLGRQMIAWGFGIFAAYMLIKIIYQVTIPAIRESWREWNQKIDEEQKRIMDILKK